MIPKVIHYCWFGGGEKPDLLKACIASWKKYCPDYEIKEWNERNFDVNMFTYTKEAYEAKKWAFVSDVARLMIVYTYGGIYLDTDVELLGNIDFLLNYPMFMFFESERLLNTGLGFGAEKNNDIIKSVLFDYENKSFYKNNGKYNMMICPEINTEVITNLISELKLDGTTQICKSYAFMSCNDYNKIMYHYGSQTWTDTPRLGFQKRPEFKDTKLKRFFRKPSRVAFVKKNFGKRVYRLYLFFAYDFQEYGVKYYIGRTIRHFK